jgi:hypothetical protein
MLAGLSFSCSIRPQAKTCSFAPLECLLYQPCLTRLAASSTILLKLSGLVHVWLKYLYIVMVCFISSGSLKTAYLRFFGTLEQPNPIGSSKLLQFAAFLIGSKRCFVFLAACFCRNGSAAIWFITDILVTVYRLITAFYSSFSKPNKP